MDAIESVLQRTPIEGGGHRFGCITAQTAAGPQEHDAIGAKGIDAI